MKSINILLLTTLIVPILISCSRDPMGPPRDVAYYDKHRDERDEVIAKCANDAQFRFHPNCSNAIRARTNMHFGPNSSNAAPKVTPEDVMARIEKNRKEMEANRALGKSHWSDGALEKLANAGNNKTNEE